MKWDIYSEKSPYWRFTPKANAQARQMYARAVELDPKYAEAYAQLGATYWIDRLLGLSQSLERAFELVQKAVLLDDALPRARALWGELYLWKNHQHDRAIAEAERAVTLDPNNAPSYVDLGWILTYSGRPEEGIAAIKKAMRLNPHYPFYYSSCLGDAYATAGQYEEAIAAYKRVLSHTSDHLGTQVGLAASYGELGRKAEARAAAAEVLRLIPNFSLEGYRLIMPYKDPADLERQLAALRKAGLK